MTAGHTTAGATAGDEVPAGRPVLVLRKVTTILDVFAEHGWDLSAQRVGELTDLPSSTVRRLLANLVAEGFLDRTGEGYRPGGRLVGWQASARHAVLARLAQPILERVRDETEETAVLFVRDGLSRTIVALAATRHVVKYVISTGEVWPLHAGSGGRVLLAFDPEATQQLLQGELAQCAPGTITDPEQLRADLAAVRSQGYAESTAERAPGTAGASAPVFAPNETVAAAVGIAGPVQRVDTAALRRARPVVLRAACELSHALGHTPASVPAARQGAQS
jgi:DNA-binding IclR family transcriptional regulator